MYLSRLGSFGAHMCDMLCWRCWIGARRHGRFGIRPQSHKRASHKSCWAFCLVGCGNLCSFVSLYVHMRSCDLSAACRSSPGERAHLCEGRLAGSRGCGCFERHFGEGHVGDWPVRSNVAVAGPRLAKALEALSDRSARRLASGRPSAAHRRGPRSLSEVLARFAGRRQRSSRGSDCGLSDQTLLVALRSRRRSLSFGSVF